MKIYNMNGCFIPLFLPIAIFTLVGVPYFIVSEWPNFGLLILGVPVWLMFFLSFRDMFCPFVINEKGITSRWVFRNIFIAWDEMRYVGVGALQTQGDKYRFTMYFSKTALKKICFKNTIIFLGQNRRHFYIVYKDGLLDEVLKYVDEEKIQNVEKIRKCTEPEQQQMGWSEELREEFKVDWDA